MMNELFADAEMLHDEAMENLELSIFSKHEKKEEGAKQYLLKAFEDEKEAAEMFKNTEIEPTRSILYRSAANLANQLGLYKKALELCKIGKTDKTPKWVTLEFDELESEIKIHMAFAELEESIAKTKRLLACKGFKSLLKQEI